MVMRVLPRVDNAAPRLPREKSYSFFIGSPLLRFGFANRNQPRIVSAVSPDHHHQRAERIRAYRAPPNLTCGRIVLHSKGEWVKENTVAIGQRDAVLSDVRCVLPGVKLRA